MATMFLRGIKRFLIMNVLVGALVNCVYVLITFNILTLNYTLQTDARIHSTKTNMIRMDENLEEIPKGTTDVEMLNVAYNLIEELQEYVFWNNSYRNVKKLILSENLIHTVHIHAFKGLRNVKMIDMSNNNLTSIDPYTFKSNVKLQKLVLSDNLISFNRVQLFLMSRSIETLVLSRNRIKEIYDVTFLGLPNLRNLILSDNKLTVISSNSFRELSNLNYLSLANTGVHRLRESMFRQIPKMLNLEGTPLADSFQPPLKQVKDDAVIVLINLNRKFGS